MRTTRPVEPHPERAPATDHPVLRLLAPGALVEVLWGVGLLVVLGFVSVTIWALLNTIGRL